MSNIMFHSEKVDGNSTISITDTGKNIDATVNGLTLQFENWSEARNWLTQEMTDPHENKRYFPRR